MQVIKSVAQGMRYLHSFSPPILHRDIKPGNILVSKNGTCKITDFGVSRLMAEGKARMTRDAGTLMYMAPECFDDRVEYGEKSDVFSYGLVLLELMSGEPPYPVSNSNHSFIASMQNHSKVQPNIHALPPETPAMVRELIIACIQFEITQRPSFEEIVKRLEAK
jgi:serine/threonine protein kinase